MNTKPWTDDEIAAGIKAGGLSREKALYHIFTQQGWKGLVVTFIRQNGGNEQDGEDMAQNALIILDRNVRQNKFKGESSLKTYFLSIARFQWYKELRSRRPTAEVQPEHYEELAGNVEDSYISKEKKQYFAKALEKIGLRCKKILMLQQLEHTLEEIARQVELSSAAMAKKEAYRCRMRFRKFLDENPGWKSLIE